MTVTFRVPTYLRRFTAGESSVSVEPYAATVGEALTLLYERYPGVRDRVHDERGAVRLHVNVFVDGESIRHTGGLATPVADGAEIAIIPAVSGGNRSPQITDASRNSASRS